MGRDERENAKRPFKLITGIQDESTVPGVWGSTGHRCIKCGSPNQELYFCRPNGEPRVPLCEVTGEHIHRVCSGCHYPWVERPADQLLEMIQNRRVPAESDPMLAFALLLDDAAHAGDNGHFERETLDKMVGKIVCWSEVEGGLKFHVEDAEASA